MKFKAAVLVESKKPLVIEELEVPVLKYENTVRFW
jgi:hypothetical protein